MKKYKDAEEIINKNKEVINGKNSDSNYINQKFECFNSTGCKIESDMNHKDYLLLAETYIDCRLKRYDKAEQNLLRLINKKFDSNKNQKTSKYYYQIMLYILSLQNKKYGIVDLLKHRWNELQNRNINGFIEYKNGDKIG